jgi:cobalt-zinc-cadmium efflux system outer membrane protein
MRESLPIGGEEEAERISLLFTHRQASCGRREVGRIVPLTSPSAGGTPRYSAAEAGPALRRWFWWGALVLLGSTGSFLAAQAPPVKEAAALSAAAPSAEGAVERLPALVLPPPRPRLTLAEAVRWALERNPELAAFRQQRGIAAAAVIIAKTYPYNPVYEAKFSSANGPTEAGITNRLVQEQRLLFQVEVRGQWRYRRQAAEAGLTRVEWEVAAQEVRLIAQVVLAFHEVLYRQGKLQVTEDRLRLTAQTVDIVQHLRAQGKLKASDVVLVRAELADAQAARQPALLALVKVQANLRRALGLAGPTPEPEGTLDAPVPAFSLADLIQLARERRPDLRAKTAAVAEAQAKLRLEIANRFGNPTLGPSYDLDPTSTSMYGAQLVLPVPLFNQHRGEIEMRRAEQVKAVLELRQTEVQVQQDVQAALARLARAQTWAYTYQTQVLPQLERSLADLEKLFLAAEPGVDILRLLSVRRSLLSAREAYLDALWELSQARADLLLAVGEPRLVLEPAP